MTPDNKLDDAEAQDGAIEHEDDIDLLHTVPIQYRCCRLRRAHDAKT